MRVSAPRVGIAAAALLLALPLAARSAPAEGGVPLLDRWVVLRASGADAGYEHEAMRRVVGADHGQFFVTTQRMVLHLSGTDIVREIIWTERADGSLVSIRSHEARAGRSTSEEIAFSGGKARITSTVFGQSRTNEAACPAAVIGPHRLDELGKQKLRKAGDRLDAVVFSPGEQAAVRVRETAAGLEETKLLDGSSKSLLHVDRTEARVPAAVTLWLDPAGNPVKLEIHLPVQPVVGYLTTRGRALSAGKARSAREAAGSQECAAVQRLRSIPHPRRIESAVLEITPKSKGLDLSAMNLGLATHRQVVEPGTDGSLLVRSTREVPPDGKTGSRPLREVAPGLADYLAPSFLVQSDAPEIQAIAEEEVGAERDGWQAACKLERWVCDALRYDGTNRLPVTALEALHGRKGDCKAHAVLFCALCRAAGIPCRIAVGLEYAPQKGAWLGHAWNEVHLDGVWYPVDATNAYGFVDPLHLRLSAGGLKDGSLLGAFAKLGALLGEIDIATKQVTYRGKTLDLDALKLAWGGTHYANPAWGISFDLPGGGRVEPATRHTGLVLATYRSKDAHGALSADDMRPGTTFAQILHGRKAESVEVGGVPAAILPVKKRWHVLVFDGKSLFVFVDYGSRSALDALLKTVRLQ